jgi:hypothetical protein
MEKNFSDILSFDGSFRIFSLTTFVSWVEGMVEFSPKDQNGGYSESDSHPENSNENHSNMMVL